MKQTLKEIAEVLLAIDAGKPWEYRYSSTDEWMSPGTLHADVRRPLRVIRDCHIRIKPWQLPAPPAGRKWHREDWTEEMLSGGWRPLLLNEPVASGDMMVRCGGVEWFQPLYSVGAPPDDPNYFCRTRRPLPPFQMPPCPEWTRYHNPDGLPDAGAGYRFLTVLEINTAPDLPFMRDMWWSSGKWTQAHINSLCVPTTTYRCAWDAPFPAKPAPKAVPLGPEDVPPGSVIQGAGELDSPGWCLVTSCSRTGIRLWRHSADHQKEITWAGLKESGVFILRPGQTEWQPCSKTV